MKEMFPQDEFDALMDISKNLKFIGKFTARNINSSRVWREMVETVYRAAVIQGEEPDSFEAVRYLRDWCRARRKVSDCAEAILYIYRTLQRIREATGESDSGSDVEDPNTPEYTDAEWDEFFAGAQD